MELSGLVLVQRFEPTLQPLFAPLQQGVLSKSGCEKIVHRLNSLYRDGSCILSVDVKNAFNSPSRPALAKAVYGLATLKPFQRFFHAEYATASELLYYGNQGHHVGTIPSTNGVRQGSTLSSVYFCALLQPILETLSAEHPDITINAYVDDVTIASKNPERLASAFSRLKTLLEEQNLIVAPKKCVWFGGLEEEPLPQELESAGVITKKKATKILGAFIGDDKSVSERLIQSLTKHNDSFRRLKLMGVNNVSCNLLSRCINVRQAYHLRAHNPTASAELATRFDKEVENVLTSWFGHLSDEQIALLRMPTKKGGLGLTDCSSTREAAYRSSCHSVLERPINNSARTDGIRERNVGSADHLQSNIPPVDETTTAAQKHIKIWKKMTHEQSNIAKVLEKVTHKGNNGWTHSDARLIPSHLFSLAVMPRLGIAHPDLPSHITCPGCRILLDSDSILTHIMGCTKCGGLNATTKHNTLVNFIYELCMKTGIPCEKEPRALSTFRCTQCNEIVNPNHRKLHEKTCGGRSFHRSGPDIVIYWATGEIYYDLTVIHELAPSNLDTKCAHLFRDACRRKHDTYVKTGKIMAESFQCIPVLSGGAMHSNTKALMDALADACGMQRKRVYAEFQLLLQELNGAVAYSQLSRYLRKEDKSREYAF